MPSRAEVFQIYARERGLEPAGALSPGPLTPLLAEGNGAPIDPAVRGKLPGGVTGAAGHFSYTRNKTFRFHVAITEVPESQQFAPRLFCVREGRRTRDDHFYGFGARHSKVWTESEALSERYTVTTSPYQDPNWMRQLFSPTFIDWLVTAPPPEYSFELAYGTVLGAIEEDFPGIAELDALCGVTSEVASRIRTESHE